MLHRCEKKYRVLCVCVCVRSPFQFNIGVSVLHLVDLVWRSFKNEYNHVKVVKAVALRPNYRLHDENRRILVEFWFWLQQRNHFDAEQMCERFLSIAKEFHSHTQPHSLTNETTRMSNA